MWAEFLANFNGSDFIEYLCKWAVNPDNAFAEDFQDLFGVNME